MYGENIMFNGHKNIEPKAVLRRRSQLKELANAELFVGVVGGGE